MKHKDKQWGEVKGESSWRMFKIMAEFVEGFEKMNKIGPCISIYGSARTKPNNPYYLLSEKLAQSLVKEGYGIITGGGPGIMEAANKGAHESKGKSIGLNIDLPFETAPNKYIDPDKLINHNYFFVRKVMFVKYAQAFVFLPGGYGTLDELFECLTLIQTKKIEPVPIVLMGKHYWEGLINWITEVMLHEEQNVSQKDLDLFYITDNPNEVIEHINDYYKNTELKPNF